jgi:hypothetical protein
LVGASAPVNVAYLRVGPPAPDIRLAPVSCPYSSAQHIPRLKRSPLRVVYATSENHWRSVATAVATSHKVPASHRYSGAVPVAHRHRVSLIGHIPRLPSVDAFRHGRPGICGWPAAWQARAAARERYYFRMRPAWAFIESRERGSAGCAHRHHRRPDAQPDRSG